MTSRKSSRIFLCLKRTLTLAAAGFSLFPAGAHALLKPHHMRLDASRPIVAYSLVTQEAIVSHLDADRQEIHFQLCELDPLQAPPASPMQQQLQNCHGLVFRARVRARDLKLFDMLVAANLRSEVETLKSEYASLGANLRILLGTGAAAATARSVALRARAKNLSKGSVIFLGGMGLGGLYWAASQGYLGLESYHQLRSLEALLRQTEKTPLEQLGNSAARRERLSMEIIKRALINALVYYRDKIAS